MMPWYKFLFITVAVLLCFVGIHEVTHIAVAHNFGCEVTSGGFYADGWLSAFYVETVCPSSSVENQSAYSLAQSNVDAIGYQSGLMLTALCLLIFFLSHRDGE